MSYEQAVHHYEPDETGRCRNGWWNQRGEWIECRSTQRASVLHDDPEAEFRQMHWHDGRDCMCFEDENGPTHQEALRTFVKARGGDETQLAG